MSFVKNVFHRGWIEMPRVLSVDVNYLLDKQTIEMDSHRVFLFGIDQRTTFSSSNK